MPYILLIFQYYFLAKLSKCFFLASSFLYLTIALVFVFGLSSILFLLFERLFMEVNWIKKYFPQKYENSN